MATRVELKTFELLPAIVPFRLTSINGQTDQSQTNKAIYDVIETDRPPEVPRLWFHPPSEFGAGVWDKGRRSAGRGLPNFANICFLNSTVQALAYCPAFSQDCLSGRHTDRCLRHARHEVCGFCNFEGQIQALFDSGQSRPLNGQAGSGRFGTPAEWNPTFLKLIRRDCEFRKTMGSDWYGQQNCAHEWFIQFLTFLIKYDLPPEFQSDYQNGKLSSADISTTYPMQLFSSCIKDSKTCQTCHKSSVKYELMTCLRLPLNKAKDLGHAMTQAFKPELLAESNQPFCDHCGVPRDKVATRAFLRPPNILALLVERTGIDLGCGQPRVVKNNKPLEIHPTISLNGLLSAEAQQYFPLEQHSVDEYVFCAAVCHRGSASFGHYWAVVAAPSGEFYECNDEVVRLITPSIAFTMASNHGFLVFYQRRWPVDQTTLSRISGAPISVYRPRMEMDLANPEKERLPPFSLRICLEIGGSGSTGTDIRRVAEPRSLRQHGRAHLRPRSTRFATFQSVFVLPPNRQRQRALVLRSMRLGRFLKFSRMATVHKLQRARELLDKASIQERCIVKRKRTVVRESHVKRHLVETRSLDARRSPESAMPVQPEKTKVPLPAAPFPVSSSSMTGGEVLETSARKKRRSVGSEPSTVEPFPHGSPRQPQQTISLQKKRRIVEEPLKPDLQNEKSRRLTSQYGGQDVERWSDDGKSPNEPDSFPARAFEDLQKQLQPTRTKRNRHDQQYDRGKTKKVRKKPDQNKAAQRARFSQMANRSGLRGDFRGRPPQRRHQQRRRN